jgi:TonB family protein
MPLSSAKAEAINAPLPVYPYQAKRHHITGDGVCVITVDTVSGKVTNATMKQSTGNAILDKSTIEAFRQWRFKPGTVSRRVQVPISYKPALGVIPAQIFTDHVVVYEKVLFKSRKSWQAPPPRRSM